MSDHVTLMTSLVETEMDGGLRGITLSGEPYASALVGAVAENYWRLTERPKPELSDELIGEKITIVKSGENMLGGGSIVGIEGRIFQGSRGLAILPKGKRSKGYQVKEDGLLDIIEGWRMDEAQRLVVTARAHYPELVNLKPERLAQLPGEDEADPVMCSLALFGRNPVFGGSDCVWLIGEYWPEDDICDRNVLLIRPEFGVSEHGSCYGRELLTNRALGEIVGFEPISYGEAIGLCDKDFDEATSWLFNRPRVAAAA
jgi:hypothetical protein